MPPEVRSLDGDGYLSQMRQYVGAGKGTHVVDERDPARNAMLNVGAGKGDYLMFSEGTDNDGDGRYDEDGVAGLDLHRNYPYNWHVMPEDDATDRNLICATSPSRASRTRLPWTQPMARYITVM
ncbi:hypothetical protein ACQEUX_12775 [Micromonospora sp. CA-259024]|uniref:hypothetical protein n=1 Tax=Micromonospora sp. CA-259024 TaxID=3239965 RepID=UPI003D8BACDA